MMVAQNSSKKWMFIGGGVIVAAAIVFGFQNYPPQPKDAAGTIGAAQRYHEPQISAADVKVSQDELTTWIQSETFDRIVKDPKARKLFTDASVATALADAGRQMARGKVASERAVTLAPGDAGKPLIKQIMVTNPLETASRVPVKMSLEAAKELASSFDSGSAARLMDNFVVGPDGVRKQELLLALEPGDAIRLQKVFAGEKAANTALQSDADALQRVFLAVERAHFIDLVENNDALIAAYDNVDFVQAIASNQDLAIGLRSRVVFVGEK